MKREYFYKDQGQIKPYIYCSLCGAGPFKEEEKDQIQYAAGDRQKIYHCKACHFVQTTKLNNDNEVKRISHPKIAKKNIDVKSDIVEKNEIYPEHMDKKLNELISEANGKIHTPIDGSFFLILVKTAADKTFCLSCNDIEQCINDLNTCKIKKYEKLIHPPVTLVYKRAIEEEDKLLFERYLKVKTKTFRCRLIENYNNTVQELSQAQELNETLED